MNLKKNIPNAITCGNLICGCLALVKCFEGNLVWVAYLVGIAAILDFFDGFTARLLKVNSAIGKDLDSLVDMVTFGVVPGMLMFQLIKNCSVIEIKNNIPFQTLFTRSYVETLLPYSSFLIPIFSAIRLAKFNNDSRQSNSFIGLPTPANAILICSIPLVIRSDVVIPTSLIFNSYFLSILSCILSFLLVAELPLIALKFKNFNWKENKIRFIFLGLSAVLLAVFQVVGIPLVIILYLLISSVNNLFLKRNN